MTEAHKRTFRYKMFKIVLLFSIPFWFLGGIKGLVFDGLPSLVYLDMAFFVISLISMLIIQLTSQLNFATTLFCSSWLIGFVLYWKYLGGVEGPFSYAYFSLLVVFIGVLPRSLKIFYVMTLCTICVVLSWDYVNQDLIEVLPVSAGLINPLGLDYVVNAFILGIVAIYLKKSFDQKRYTLQEHNQNLAEVNLELRAKRRQLVSQQEEIQRIKTNLEVLVHEHTVMLEEKNKQLADYAYDNAHIVRAPLSNILGILNLITTKDNKTPDQKTHLEHIKQSADQLDQVVRKINMILR